MRSITACAAALGALLVLAGPAAAIEQPPGAAKNMELMSSFPEAKYATAINFLQYGKGSKQRDIMIATGRFGLITYDLADPAHPRKLDTLENEALRLTGDPPSSLPGSTSSTYWQNEDMDVDQDRKLVFMARDPRSFGGTTASDTSIAGVYIVDLEDPEDLQLITFHQLPTGHTTTCVNGCDYLWTGGPASAVGQRPAWPGGRPIIVTDVRDPRNPKTSPQPVDLFRNDGQTAYSHDVQVDSAGIAWVSGQGGVRGYWTEGRHFDPVQGVRRQASATDPVPYAGGRFSEAATPDGFMHNSERPVGKTLADGPVPGDEEAGSLIMATEEADAPPDCNGLAQFTIASLEGSYDGQAWRSTPQQPFRLRTVGTWNPHGQEGTAVNDTIYCSAHYFDVRKRFVAYSWYDQGTRILDVSDPTEPKQVAYYRPDGGVSWAPYFHRGYFYVADHGRGVEVLKVSGAAAKTASAGKELVAPKASKRHLRLVRAASAGMRPDPQLGWLCPLPAS
jgi:hypothetical protein